jgi:hypothetical protein
MGAIVATAQQHVVRRRPALARSRRWKLSRTKLLARRTCLTATARRRLPQSKQHKHKRQVRFLNCRVWAHRWSRTGRVVASTAVAPLPTAGCGESQASSSARCCRAWSASVSHHSTSHKRLGCSPPRVVTARRGTTPTRPNLGAYFCIILKETLCRSSSRLTILTDITGC